jgi:hypothetical protein
VNLLRAMNCEYSRSKGWSLASIIFTGCFSLFALVGSLGPSRLAKTLAVAAFISQIAIVECRKQSDAHYRLAEAVRRPALLLAGLGRQPSIIEIQRIAAQLGVLDASNRIEPNTYYASKLTPGPQRLVEIIEESSFWTADLAEQIADFLDGGFKATVVLFVLAAYMAVYARWTTTYGDAAGKILLAFATFYFAGATTELRNKYRDLAQAAQRVMAQCTVVKSKPDSELLREAMVLADEYNCALANAPIIPEFVYDRHQKRLNSAWTAKCESLLPSDSGEVSRT